MIAKRILLRVPLLGTFQSTFRLLVSIIAITSFGCAPAFHLVHDGNSHPEEYRNGRLRPAGVVPNIWDHVIAVDGQGVPHDPTRPKGRALNIEEFRRQIAGMLVAMRRFHAGGKDRKVLIFAHGGLNAPADALAAADDEIERIMDAGYFPIFLNWNSDLLDTYGEHLTRITQGQTDDGSMRKLLIPLYLLADVGRAAVRIPVVWAHQIGTDISAGAADVQALRNAGKASAAPGTVDLTGQRWANSTHGRATAEVFQKFRDAQRRDDSTRRPGEPRTEIRVYIGPDLDVNAGYLAEMAASYLLTVSTKFGLSPFIDWLGTPAWQNMSRRTLMAFDGQLGGNPVYPADDDMRALSREKRAAQAANFTTTGAFAVFRDEFLNVVGTREAHDGTTAPSASTYDVTLIGHSMGTMVLNEWLRRDQLELDRKKPEYSNIVYMAAACSVRDFGRAVVPYLLHHRGTQFYNLMLHPVADLRERERAWDLPPRGSLLVWLDDFLTEPQTPLDRTLGRWTNIVAATNVIPQAVRGQVTLKAFALAPYDDEIPPPGQPDYGPQAHGQFRQRPFWLPSFWYSEDPVIAPPRNQPVK